METLEELKAIIAGKPEGANQVEIHSSGNVNCYIRYEENGVQVFNGGKWIHSSGKGLAHCWFIRSLSDIERIIKQREMLELAWKAIGEAGYEDYCNELRDYMEALK